MIPLTESITTPKDSCAASNTDYCEESHCNQLQTAADVYRRIVERLQRQNTQGCSPNPHEDILKQLWIASFTGGNVYYRA